MKPRCYVRTLADNTVQLCAWCNDFKAGIVWAEQRGHEISSGLCDIHFREQLHSATKTKRAKPAAYSVT